ncbi:MAG: Ni/Fe hydrogenase subunit alpha [Candidatus Aenigmatarchaeota archaeon]|nr:MAG: Ni/Fe hydrogenase subunit alpha [Candidatus Aenigmarchaeota archaeon]
MDKSYTLESLTKVEGHARLDVEMDGKNVKKAEIAVFEPSRYFEHMVRGKPFDLVPTISQRICGICSVMHTVAAIKAVENGTGIKPSPQTVDLRRLLLHASNLHSHTAHLFFFTAPDYLGVDDVMGIARKHKKKMELAIELQKRSSDIVKQIGGRSIHPVNCRVGYFNSVPDLGEVESMTEQFREIKQLSTEAAELFLSFKYPKFENKTQYLALQEKGVYDLYEGSVSVFGGKGFTVPCYRKNIEEETIQRSTAKYAMYKGKPYMTGALARLNISGSRLSPSAKKLLRKHKIKVPNFSTFTNNIAQAVEMVHLCDRALEILGKYDKSGFKEEKKQVKPKAGEGVAACEAPRGTLYHHYRFSPSGKCTYANIITPTCQNVRNMEYDMQQWMPSIIKESDANVKKKLEMLIRAYDPCFSCSTHFLELKLRR